MRLGHASVLVLSPVQYLIINLKADRAQPGALRTIKYDVGRLRLIKDEVWPGVHDPTTNPTWYPPVPPPPWVHRTGHPRTERCCTGGTDSDE